MDMHAKRVIAPQPSEVTSNLYRGNWISEPVATGQKVPVGGKHFMSDKLDIMLKLDFEKLGEGLEKFSPSFGKLIEEKIPAAEEYLRKINRTEIDAKTFLTIHSIQGNVNRLLAVSEDANTEREGCISRSKLYANNENLSLSDLVGISACAERAILAKHLFDRIGMPASYMGGVMAQQDSDHTPTNLVDHSFIVLPSEGKTLVFDVANPHNNGLPKIVIMDHEMNLEIFKGKQNLLVMGKSIFSNTPTKLYYGVGNPYLL